MNATARAQAADALEQAARALKRQIRENRELLGIVRRAQVGVLGITVETHTAPQEGAQHGNNQEARAEGNHRNA